MINDEPVRLNSVVVLNTYSNALSLYHVHYRPGRAVGLAVVEPLVSHSDCEVGGRGGLICFEES